MEHNSMTTKKALLVLGMLLFLVALLFVTPAKSVGIKKVKRPSLLDTQNDLVALGGDTNNNNIPGWKDLLNESMSSSTKAAAAQVTVTEEDKRRLSDPNNMTSSFAKNLAVATAYAQKQGTLTDAQKQQLASDVAQEEVGKIVIKTYELTDLRLEKNETDASRKKYANTLGSIYTKNKLATISADDIDALQAYSTSKDAAILAKFVVKKNIIDTVITQMLDLSVPYSAATYHLLVINALSSYQSFLDNVSKADSDPLRAAAAFHAYQPALRNLYSSLQSMGLYFQAEDITFTKNDPGYILVSGTKTN